MKPTVITYPIIDRYNHWSRDELVTPFANLNWQPVAAQYGIKIPEIVDRAMGKSVCYQCKAVYAGYQNVCRNIVDKHRKRGRYHHEYGYSFEAEHNFREECLSTTSWDLSEQFQMQLGLFNLIEQIGYLESSTNDQFDKYSNLFPEGVVQNLKIRLMSKQIDHMMVQQSQIIDGIRQIAEKMNNAGLALQF